VTTRGAFLDRIRKEVEKTPGLFSASTAPRPARPDQAAEAVRRQMAERWPEALERFKHEFERVAGVFHRVERLDGVPAVIAGIANDMAASRLVTWNPAVLGLDLAARLGGVAGLSVITPGEADEASRRHHREDNARAQIGVTGVDLAVAETGTLILLSGRGRPRATSLLPETHVAIFDRSCLLESLEQVGIMLEAWHVGPERSMSGAMINFITGPSRTADIELTLTRGVHGPKHVHAIFVDSPYVREQLRAK
jgi:L-lactate dehydrogenase complex protein LldG